MLPCTIFGPPDASPLVALHGFLGRGTDWADLAARLPDLRIIAPDLPGHSAAHDLPPETFTMEGAAAAVLATLDAQRIQRAALLGYSMGGRLALYLALHAPERFTHLVLESASPGLRTDAERAARRTLDGERADEIVRDLPGFLDRWYAQPLFASTPAALRDRLAQERLSNDARGLARSLRFMGTGAQPSLWDALPALAVPTLALVGAHDAKFVQIAHDMAARSRCIHVTVLPDAGHTAHLDAPEAFIRTLRDGLAA